MKATIVTIGDEILIGQILDTNSAWLAKSLQDMDVEVIQLLSISDEDNAIQEALKHGLEIADLVILTGGLGPTKDDITKKSIAAYLGVDMYYDEDLHNLIKDMFKKFGRESTEAHRLQAFLPRGVQKLTNKMGTAPGMLFEKDGKTILSMPGVPYEMNYIFKESFSPILKSRHSKIHVYHKTIQTAGTGETVIADKIEAIVSEFPDFIKIAYLPSLGKVRLRLSGKHSDTELLQYQIDSFTSQIVDILGDLVFGFDEDTLQSTIQKMCIERKITVATAESCTGGNIGKTLVSQSGSSGYYIGGVIAYSNELKKNLLNVNASTLENFGSVSEEVVREMTAGVCRLTGSNIGISVSGIAGPSGGSVEKPVGTIHIHVGNSINSLHRKLTVTKDRNLNIQYATNVAMMMVLHYLKTV